MEKFVYGFLKNTYLYELPAKILSVVKDADGLLIELSDSIFHPQGGGQPNDVGKIILPNSKEYPILGTINDRQTGKIQYRVALDEQKLLQPGNDILMAIDKETRIRNARLHSAGHFLDVAVNRLKLQWKPGKGYHFPDSPYVEYIGVCADNSKTKDDLQKEIEKLSIQRQEQPVRVSYLTVEEAIKNKFVDELFKGGDVRMVDIMGVACPCAGTHVSKISQIGKMEVTKVAKKGSYLRKADGRERRRMMGQLQMRVNEATVMNRHQNS